MPTTTLECIRLLRHVLDTATVSVEIEKPGREGLPELAAEADVVFYSRTWAEVGGRDGFAHRRSGELRREAEPRSYIPGNMS